MSERRAPDEEMYERQQELLGRVVHLGTLVPDHWIGMWAEARLHHSFAARATSCSQVRRTLSEAGAGKLRFTGLGELLLREEPGPMPEDVLLASDPRLPDAVRNLAGAPFGLWWAGNLDLLQQRRVGIVGSRRPRIESRTLAMNAAGALARSGVVIVSGLAIGIDALSHEAALDAGGGTIAVLPCGIDRPYPVRHAPLVQRILENGGLVVSEYGPGVPPERFRFVERNRIIAALSEGVIVVQARARSGSLHTAEFAMQLGIDVGITPSFPGDVEFEGSLRFLEDGASVVATVPGALKFAGVIGADVGTCAHALEDILATPRTVGEVTRLSGLDLADAMGLLLELEMSGMVRVTPDGRYVNVARPAVAASGDPLTVR